MYRYLDDLWDPAHAELLDYIDDSTASRVLISTRIKVLCGVNAVEIAKPNEAEAIAIVMAAANMPPGSAVPAEAAEIVRLCGNLPIALAMAGKLICELDLAPGAQWDGVSEILRDELKDNFHSSSAEASVIRASLASLSGSEREKKCVRNLFSLFALVPEDTFVPLDILALIFDALFLRSSGKKVAILHLRKWLRILIDRSLVLGTVDRPQLHDLVLDFCIAQYSEEQLRAAHVQVVNTLRENRTVAASGIRAWSSMNRGHTATAYVLNEIKHHVANAIDEGDENVLQVEEWMCDVPFDSIVFAVARQLGRERLEACAERAEKAGDDFKLACMLSLLAQLCVESADNPKALEVSFRGVQALWRIRDGPKSAQCKPKDTRDFLEIRCA